MRDFFQSKKIIAIASIIGILAVILVIFELGVTVGYHKAAFDYRWGDEYYRAFGPQPGSAAEMGSDFPGAHGISGTVIRVAPPFAFVEGPDKVEKVVRIGSSTNVVEYRNAIDPNKLSEGDFIVVIGSPSASSSEINAHFVRVLPPQSSAGSSSNL